MRMLLIAVAVAIMTLIKVPAGRANEGPWCSLQSIGGDAVQWNCEMQNFEQCRLEIIAGNRGFCMQNPRWPSAYQSAAGSARHWQKRRSRRH